MNNKEEKFYLASQINIPKNITTCQNNLVVNNILHCRYERDGISQEDELTGLSDAGVKSINLNAVTTNIEIDGNLITEASKYTDSDGNLELAADIELTFDSRITKIDTSTIEDYVEHPDSNTLPNLRGYGIVSDSYITYKSDLVVNNNLHVDVREVA